MSVSLHRDRRHRPALTPRKLPRQARARATVEAILQAAAYILPRFGYEATTTNHIAERAGVNIASLYQYFPNKRAILFELMHRHVATTREGLAGKLAASQGRSTRERVRALIEMTSAAHAVDPKLHEIFTTWGPRLGFESIHTELDDAIATESQAWIASMRGRLRDPALAVWIAQTTVHAVFHLAFVERPEIAVKPELADELVRLLVPFLSPRAPVRAAGASSRPRRRRASPRS
ncbi:MAG TPA: TetR/AcrR family transcriptional regulator [Kofleriaceae bacterium]